MSADSAAAPVEPQEPAPPIQPAVHAPGKPRRPHHKSRTGCLQCKQRKVKCDEQKPICKKCETQGATCSYLQTHPLKRGPPTIQSMLISPLSTTAGSSPQTFSSEKFSPAPSPLPSTIPSTIPSTLPPLHSPTFPATFTMLDMELLHFWTHQSAASFIDVQCNVDLFQTTVVHIAFSYPFLMHEILSISALHLARLHPQKSPLYIQASETHASRGLDLFQSQIANLTAENCHACFAFSTMLFVHAWASQDTGKPTALFFRPKALASEPELVNIKWVKLHRGSQSILQSIYPVLADGPLEVIFTPWRYLDVQRQDPLLPNETHIFNDLAEAFAPLSPTSQAVLSEALSKLKRIFSMLTYYPNISKLQIVMAWFPMIPEQYLKMMEQKTQEALLLVLYYCVALKRLEHLWWMKGKAENLLNTVLAELGPGWERWTRWPVEQVLGKGGIMGFGTIMNA